MRLMASVALMWPPGAKSWKRRGGVPIPLTPAARLFEIGARMSAMQAGAGAVPGQMDAVVRFRPKDGRGRKLHGLAKVALEALFATGAWLSRGQVAGVRVVQEEPDMCGRGCVIVTAVQREEGR